MITFYFLKMNFSYFLFFDNPGELMRAEGVVTPTAVNLFQRNDIFQKYERKYN